MRTLAALFLLAAAMPAAAQQPEIIGLTHDGMLTWTNAETNVYYGVEGTYQMDWEWLAVSGDPPYWKVFATQHVNTVMLPFPAAYTNQMTNVWAILGWEPNAYFARIRISDEVLNQRPVTNRIMIVNSSTSVLTEVGFAMQANWVRTQETNLPPVDPDANTSHTPLYKLYPEPLHAHSGPEGICVDYTQDGSVRDTIISFIPWGPRDKTIVVTVSNDSRTIEYQWMDIGKTLPYE